MAALPAKKELPVLATTMSIFTLFFAHWRYAIKIAWPWLLFLTILNVPLMEFSEGAVNPEGTAQKLSSAENTAFVLSTLVAMAGWSSIAVLWHRRLLRNEVLEGIPIDLSSRAGHYLLRFIFIVIIVIIPSVIIVLVSNERIKIDVLSIILRLVDAPENHLIFTLISIAITMILSIVSLRLSVALPAAALGEATVTPATAWSATSGHSFRLLIVFILSGSPAYIASLISFWITVKSGSHDSFVGALFLSFLSHATYFVWVMIGVTLLSVAYAVFIEERESETLTIKAIADS